jgi:hypothetical protein
MQNPPRKPKAPRGYDYRWTPPYSYRRKAGRRRIVGRKYETIYKTVRVPGHYVLVKVSPERKKPRRPALISGWQKVTEFEDHYRKEYDVAHVDPIYRYNRETDVVRLADGLVWDRPIRADVRGTFVMARVWYIVHHETQDEYYIYVRTFSLPVALSSLSMASDEKMKWEATILGEYEGKEYMEVQEFLAWTVFDERERKPRRLHKVAPRRVSREKAFETTRRGDVRRVLTRWEIKKVLATAMGSEIGLRRRKGESLEDAFRRLPQSQRRAYRRALMQAVKALEDRWTEERRRRR